MINLREIRNDAKLIDIINYIDVILPKWCQVYWYIL